MELLYNCCTQDFTLTLKCLECNGVLDAWDVQEHLQEFHQVANGAVNQIDVPAGDIFLITFRTNKEAFSFTRTERTGDNDSC
jgi:hypothetical protein